MKQDRGNASSSSINLLIVKLHFALVCSFLLVMLFALISVPSFPLYRYWFGGLHSNPVVFGGRMIQIQADDWPPQQTNSITVTQRAQRNSLPLLTGLYCKGGHTSALFPLFGLNDEVHCV